MSAYQTRPIFVIAQRLVQIWSAIEQELAELRALRVRRERVCVYLRTPGCNLVLGMVQLRRVDEARRNHLARLRARRRDAWTLVASVNHELGPDAGPRQTGVRSRSTAASAASVAREPKIRSYA
jgi:hypothetical protein